MATGTDYRVYDESITGSIVADVTSNIAHTRANGTVCTAETGIREAKLVADTTATKVGSDALDVGTDVVDAVNTINQNLSDLIKANGTNGINITSSVTGSGYTCPSNGFVFANICPYVSAVALVKRNGRNVLLLRNSMSGSGYIQQQNEFFAHKNDVITYSQDGVCESPSFWFYADV